MDQIKIWKKTYEHTFHLIFSIIIVWELQLFLSILKLPKQWHFYIYEKYQKNDFLTSFDLKYYKPTTKKKFEKCWEFFFSKFSKKSNYIDLVLEKCYRASLWNFQCNTIDFHTTKKIMLLEQAILSCVGKYFDSWK